MPEKGTLLTHRTLEALKKTLDELPIGIVVTDNTGSVLYVNDCLTENIGSASISHITDLLADFPNTIYTDTTLHFPLSFTSKIKPEKRNGIHFHCRVKRNNAGNYLFSVTDVDVHLDQLHAINAQKDAAENLLRSAVIGEGTLEEALAEICRIAAVSLNVTRVNIWEFGNEQAAITSLINFDARVTELLSNVTLYRYQIPNYFRLIETEEIIPTRDALNDSNTAELKDGYLAVNGIQSLIDVPIRISGRMFGLVCFEDTNEKREWDSGEQKFGLFISQVIALTIETSRRKKTQKELELILDEKRILLNEIHRRVRNNFTLIQDLIRTESTRATDEYHRDLFTELRNRVNSLDMLQRQLYQSEKVDRVNFRDLILDLIAGYRSTFSGNETEFVTTLDQCELNVAKASIAGLLLNEIIMHLVRVCRDGKKKESIAIRLTKINSRVQLSVVTSIIFDELDEREKMQTSFEMAEKLGSKLDVDRNLGTNYRISFEY